MSRSIPVPWGAALTLIAMWLLALPATAQDDDSADDAAAAEETDEYRIYTTAWGATLKNWKHAASTPEFLDFTINLFKTVLDSFDLGHLVIQYINRTSLET